MPNDKILLVDDEPEVLAGLEDLFSEDYDVQLAGSGQEALELVKSSSDLMAAVLDIKMAGMDGIETAREIRLLRPQLPIIFHTGYPGTYREDEIDESERPFDYVQKGEALSRLTRSVRNAVEASRLKALGTSLDGSRFGMVGRSRCMQAVYQLIAKVAASDSKVMIRGETGTGKELVARAIHHTGQRKYQKLGILNCNHKSPDIVESELFGHTQGSFTGATADRVGLFEYSNGGTVLLDEVGDLDITTQAKLLRVIESGEYARIGSSEMTRCDVRVICATHKDIEQMVTAGQFRQDLYYRLKGIVINLPPLRDRKEDVPLLVSSFCERLNLEKGLPRKVFDRSALDTLISYDWPGNVRELHDTVESLLVQVDSDIVFAADVADLLNTQESSTSHAAKNLSQLLQDYERTLIVQTLETTGGNISQAARQLRVDRANLSRKIKQFGIDPDSH